MKTRLTSLGTTLLTAIALWSTSLSASAQTGWGTALSLDGGDDYVDLGASAPVLGTNFTQEAWICPQISDTGYHGFLGYHPSQGAGLRSPSVWVFEQTRLHVGFGNGSAWLSWITTNVLQRVFEVSTERDAESGAFPQIS